MICANKTKLKFAISMLLIISIIAFIYGIFILYIPQSNSPWKGNPNISSAITASFAILLAVAGLVSALYMQSARYRRETEIVDGLQSLRLILRIMLVRADRNESIEFDEEKKILLHTLQGPTGVFINYYASIKDQKAVEEEKSEKWRTLYLCISNVMDGNDLVKSIADLLDLIDHLSPKDVKKYSHAVTSTDSLNKVKKDDIIIRAIKDKIIKKEKEHLNNVNSDKDVINKNIAYLQEKMSRDEQGKKALKELDPTFEKARKGDKEAIAYIQSIVKMLHK